MSCRAAGAASQGGLLAKRWRAALLALVGLPLAGTVSPFSYLPNPPGLHHLLVGGYRYHPHSPFVNRFAALGTPDPTAQLAAQLDRLPGQTGLDPLDPQQPLVGYRVRAITTGRPRWLDAGYAEARVGFRYADGTARTDQIPLRRYGMRYDDSGTPGSRYTGLDRLFAAHLALPYLPPADDTTPRPGLARPLVGLPDLGPAANGAGTLDRRPRRAGAAPRADRPGWLGRRAGLDARWPVCRPDDVPARWAAQRRDRRRDRRGGGPEQAPLGRVRGPGAGRRAGAAADRARRSPGRGGGATRGATLRSGRGRRVAGEGAWGES